MSLIFNNFKLISYLICLLPFSIGIGPFIGEINIVVIIIFFIYYYNFEKKIFFKKNYFYFFLFFSIYFAISSLFMSKISYQIAGIAYIRFPLLSFAIAYFLNLVPDLKLKFFYAMFFCVVITVFYIIFTKIISPDIVRIYIFFRDEPIVGRYLVNIFIICSSLYIINFSIKNNFFKSKNFLIIFLLIYLVEISTFFSGERTAFALLNLFLFIFFVFFFLTFGEKLKTLLIFIVFNFILILSFVSINSSSKDRMINFSTKQIFNPNHQNVFNSEGLSNRAFQNIFIRDYANNEELIRKYSDQFEKANTAIKIPFYSNFHRVFIYTSFLIFQDYPIFGIGLKGYRVFCNYEKYNILDQSCATHPHNQYAQLLAETGIIGFLYLFISFIFCLFNLAKYFFKIKLSNNVQKYNLKNLTIFCAIFVFIFPFITSGSFENNWVNSMTYILVGIFLSEKGIVSEKKN
jgi:hypothetical protein